MAKTKEIGAQYKQALIAECYQVKRDKIVAIQGVFDARPFAPMF